MKKMIFVLCLIMFLFSCNPTNKKHNDLQINVLIGSEFYYQSLFVKKCELYPVRISLINNTDSTLFFWIMSCSWEGSFIFNSDAIGFFNLGCDKDIVDFVKLTSGKTLIYNSYLKVSNLSKLKKINNLKIGFILIHENVTFSEMKFRKILLEKKAKQNDIIWYDTPINLKFKFNKRR